MDPPSIEHCPACDQNREITTITHQFGEGSIELSMCSHCGYVLERGDAVVEDTH
jgi:Zn ribbon nucleic-acid-binding protein